jgi:hypothetical protein
MTSEMTSEMTNNKMNRITDSMMELKDIGVSDLYGR